MEAIKIVERGEKFRVILMASGSLGMNLLSGLLNVPELVTVIGFVPASSCKRHQHLANHPDEIELRKLSRDNRLTELNTNGVNTSAFLEAVKTLRPHVLLVGGWSEIIKAPLLVFPNLHIINCHGSLLPKYRGASPYVAPIFNGETQTGYTYHLIDEGIDTGDILWQEKVKIQTGETAQHLGERIAKKYGQSIGHLFERLAAGNIVPRKQLGVPSYVPAHHPEWGWIPWESPPHVIEQRMKALDTFLPLVTSFDGVVLGFEKGRVVAVVDPTCGSATTPLELAIMGWRKQPGMVVANQPDRIVVATCDPAWQVELFKPIVSPPQSPIREFLPGDQFYSLDFDSISTTD